MSPPIESGLALRIVLINRMQGESYGVTSKLSKVLAVFVITLLKYSPGTTL